MQAAAILASWFGIQASSKPPRFVVSIGAIPAGNVVIFVNGDEATQPALHVPFRGSSVSLSANPSDVNGSALVLSGDDDAGLLNVARGLALMPVSHLPPGQVPKRIGQAVRIGDFALPPARKPDDAPRWLTTDRGDLALDDQLAAGHGVERLEAGAGVFSGSARPSTTARSRT